jgi:RNA polymerase sigma-70 factor (ECF subfamily)
MDASSPFAIDVPESLLRRAQGGELRAFEQLYRLFERPVFTLALRMLGEPESAREVLHDAMLKLFQRINQFRFESPFWGWLRQIALNESLMRLRKDKRIDFEAEFDEIESEDAAPWVHADARVLETAMNKLPALTRSVLWLYHVEGYSHPEIAEATGKTISFSKSQVMRGTAKLRRLLDGNTETAPCPFPTFQPG